MKEKAFAKLNISLDVSRARDDGYHDLKMIMQSVTFCDEVDVNLNESGIFSARTNLAYVPSDDKNLAVKAAKVILGGSGQGAEITIDKKIPVGAGMAGGSADAAAVLRAVNRLLGNRYSLEELARLGERVGSDVPYCVINGTALAEGRGEILTPLNDFPDCEIVICKPSFAISTPELFKAIDRVKIRAHPDTEGIIEAVGRGDLREICRRMYNTFEEVDDHRMRTVTEIKKTLIRSGAMGAIMTGTGSAVFGIFEPGSDVLPIAENLKKEYGFAVTAKPENKSEL